MGDCTCRWRALRRLWPLLLAALLLAPVAAARAQGGWATEIATPKPGPPPAAAPPRRPAAVTPAESAPKAAPRPARPRATAAHVEGDGKRTRFRLELSSSVAASIYALSEPYRVIADLPDVDFVLPAGTGRRSQGLVSAFRYGLFEAGRARIVIDASGPVMIEGAQFIPAASGAGGHLVFDLIPTTVERFAALEQQAQKDLALRQSRYDDGAAAIPPGTKPRPVIMIDPGHGGLDPGTVAGPKLTEKDIVLAVGRQLRAILGAARRYDVHMTRDQDVFVSLEGRLRHSRRVGADLFISLHIDALAEAGLAHSVRGASVYILSEKASDEAARQLAEKENASDLLAGMERVPSSDEDHVRSILFDLIRRETANYAVEFRNLLTGRLKSRIALAREPQRAAAFKVLKQAETPAVLIELGYMSHAEDRALIAKPEWQRQIAVSIAEAVDAYFATRQAQARP